MAMTSRMELKVKTKPAKLNNQPILKGERVEGGSWSTKRRLQEKSPSRIGNGPSMEKMQVPPKKGQPDGGSQKNGTTNNQPFNKKEPPATKNAKKSGKSQVEGTG